jgi:murein DD-endopeptidase MepM/ murein hydrolase activator NlpD
MSGYLRPVDPTNGRMSTFLAHKRRNPPSQEPGVDYYCPIGTPIRAAADGRVYQIGGGILPATGRFLTLDLHDGRRVRYLHLRRTVVDAGEYVNRGDILAYSGASGYGSEYFGADSEAQIPTYTGGAHVHTTLWPRHAYSFGYSSNAIDFELYVDHSATAGGGSSPFNPDNPDPKDWLDMATLQDVQALIREGQDLVQIHYSGPSFNGIALARPGYWRVLTAEEHAQLTNHGLLHAVKTVVPVNERDFQVLRAVYTNTAAV